MKTLFLVLVLCLINFSKGLFPQFLFAGSGDPECAAPSGGSINLNQEGGIYLTATGELKVLIVFARFKNDYSSHPYWDPELYGLPPDNYNTFIDPSLQTGSTHYINLTNYFKDMSLGVYKVTGTAVSVETPNTMSYYGTAPNMDRHKATKEILQQKVDPLINFADYDNWSSSADYTHSNQSDGTVDMIIMIWRATNTPFPFGGTQSWSGEASLGGGSSYSVENGTKTIKTGYGSINSGSGVTLHYWGQSTPERNFKNAIHELGHWLLGISHPYVKGSDEHKVWGMLTRGDDGICANTYERERVAWINPTSITGNILNAPFQDYVEYGTAYKYHPSNGAANEYYYFENHQKLNIYDNATNNPNDKGIFIIHQQGIYSSSNNIRVKTSNGQWDWQSTSNATCFGDQTVPKLKPVSVNRAGKNNRDKFGIGNNDWLFYLDNSSGFADWPANGCGGWINGERVNNSFNLTYNNVFSNYSNPWARTWTNTLNNFTMEITAQNDSVVNARFYLTSPLDGKPSKPQGLTISAYADAMGDRPKLTWAANIESDFSLYEVWRKSSDAQFMGSCNYPHDWQLIGTTSSTSYIDDDGFYLYSNASCLLEYKIRAKDTQNKYSLYSSVISSEADWIGWKKGAENIAEIPLEYLLDQNYPNPFNPSTTISYAIKEDGLVTLKIFDILGREIRTLINEQKPAGNYSVQFSSDDLPSGMYVYKLQSGNFIETKKMLLLR